MPPRKGRFFYKKSGAPFLYGKGASPYFHAFYAFAQGVCVQAPSGPAESSFRTASVSVSR